MKPTGLCFHDLQSDRGIGWGGKLSTGASGATTKQISSLSRDLFIVQGHHIYHYLNGC